MGWTFTPDKPRDIRAWMTEALTWENDALRGRCLDVALVGRAARGYAAVERIDKTTGERMVFAAIFLFRHVPNAADGHVFGWKEMDETVGPFEVDCPKRILDQLTPTTYRHALDWRRRCAERLAKREAAKQIRPGDRIVFREPIRFASGDAFRFFEYAQGSTFTPLDERGRPTGLRCRIRKWRERDDWTRPFTDRRARG